jgi:hypothetical protein
MPLLHDSVDSKKLDVRIFERNLTRGVITAKQLEDALKSLPDDAENAEYVSISSLAQDGSHDGSEGSSGGRGVNH